jgi:hypothetical protein
MSPLPSARAGNGLEWLSLSDGIAYSNGPEGCAGLEGEQVEARDAER